MKKIFLFLLLGIVNFSCDYTDNKDLFIKESIKVIKDMESENNVYCDKNGIKMIYYTGNTKMLNVGFIVETAGNDKRIEEAIMPDALEYLMLLSSTYYQLFNIKVKEKKEFKNFKGITFRYYLKSSEGLMMIAKRDVFKNGNSNFTLNKFFYSYDKNNEYNYTNDIIY